MHARRLIPLENQCVENRMSFRPLRDSYDDMQGDDVFDHWILMSPEIRKAIMDAVEREFSNAEDIEIEADDDVYDIAGKTADDRDLHFEITSEGYILGWRLEMELQDLPSAVQGAIQKELSQGGSLDERMHCIEDGEEFYIVEIDRNGDELQLKISTEGEILEREWD